MGIPQPLADDFRRRAFNRAMNGIGTLGMITAALDDLQAVKKTTAYQPSIDLCRKVVQEYIKNFKDQSHFCKFDGQNHFYYPYSAGKSKEENDCVLFGRPEDIGHYGFSIQGFARLYEAVPELGIDEDFMTAAANAI
jgi:hypothetical protein